MAHYSMLDRLLGWSLVAYAHFLEPHIHRAWGSVALRHAARVGKDVRVHGRITVHGPAALTVGDHVRIGTGCFLFCKGGLEIGTNSQLSRNVTIYTANHNTAGDAIPYDDTYVCRPVRIGHSVWLGMNSSVLPGVTIGDGAIIGFGTVVAKDVPPGAIVVGPAQRTIRYRDMDSFTASRAASKLFGALWPDN
jgi:acetyltransferase-like isoleucine patch superfamily enzyme